MMASPGSCSSSSMMSSVPPAAAVPSADLYLKLLEVFDAADDPLGSARIAIEVRCSPCCSWLVMLWAVTSSY